MKRHRRQIVVDLETAVWIVRIYRWFLVDGLNIEEIVRELNADPEAPAPAKSVLDRWTRDSVIAALTNRRYRGDWSYGNTESVWLSDKDYSRKFPREAPLQDAQFEELRIISDEVWFEVQKRLSTDPKRSGRKPRNGARRKHSRLLQGKFECPEHGRRLAVTGDGGKVMLCPVCRGYKVEQRPLFTHLNRKLATDLTCEKLASLFDDETALVTNVIEICGAQASTCGAPDPVTAQTLLSQIDKLRRTIKFNRQDPGESEMEQQQTRELLRDLRHQLAEAESALSAHQATTGRSMVIPTEDEILAEVRQLRQTLNDAPKLTDERQIRLVRRLIDDLVTGRIQLYQQGERKKCQGWLQGRFEVAVVPFLIKRLTGAEIGIGDEDRAEIVIDYRKSELIAEQADTAKRFWDDGLLCKEIAVQMGLHRSRITKVLQYWHDQRGLPRPNNKTRRKRLENKQSELPFHKRIANEVIELVEAGHSNLKIAGRLRTNDGNVAKAIQWWHETRGLPVPTAADRRRKKLNRAKRMLDEGMLIKDVAGALAYSPRGLTLTLEKDAENSGGVMGDGRTRRGNATAGNLANGVSLATQTRAA
ncbi:recombinase family protein [Stieleria neptunia]|uniref:recombinase family protein n=1 Tax=Stieleria neptunia TaxID=2527979 RepID=UPI0018D26BF5|nr:recombinase family protein [Stieleria neptunia]